MPPTSAKRQAKTPPAATPPEVVDPRWLLKALGISLAAAVVLAYLAVCLLFYLGSWQLMLHPSAKVDATPHVPFQPIRFDAATTGTPRLTGWWIPAEIPSTRTILFLHDGSGSLSAKVPELDLLHTAGVNIFAIDYRGFGKSDPPHPTEARMAEDAAAALNYLVSTRHLPAAQIVPCGEGLGAVFAANLAAGHPEIAAVILENPDPDAFTSATNGSRSWLLPMRTIVQEHFDIAAALAQLKTAKLLFANTPFDSGPTRVRANQALFRSAPDPKISVTFDKNPGYANMPSAEQAYVQSIQRFLDEYAH